MLKSGPYGFAARVAVAQKPSGEHFAENCWLGSVFFIRESMNGDAARTESEIDAESKLLALAIIQLVGSVIALIIHVAAHESVYSMDKIPQRSILAYLVLLLSISLIAGLLCQPIHHAFFRAFRTKIKGVMPSLGIPTKRLSLVFHMFVIMDFLGLAFSICWTGGSERSLFAPFLFVVTSIIVLIDLLDGWKIALYAVVSVCIFALDLCERVRSHIFDGGHFVILDNRWYKVCVVGTTALCFFFPLIFDVLAKSERPQSKLPTGDNN
jgi:hypothetical protein